MTRRNKDTWNIIMYNHWKDMNTPVLIIDKEMIIVARSDCKQDDRTFRPILKYNSHIWTGTESKHEIKA